MAGMKGDRRERDNIYNRVGNALRAEEPEGSAFLRIHTGNSIREAHIGQVSKSRRAGFLSKIVADGFGAFTYPDNLPHFVKSSRDFKRKTGREVVGTIGMVKKQIHPGLEKYDYMFFIEDHIMTHFEQDMVAHMKAMGAEYGFSTTLGYREGI